ncbi:MAG: asparagine synthase (glutamine-hydrolyzing) [Promethearchaeota archaeon]
MCSISGFTWEDKQLINKMNNLLSYRGPDDTGIFIEKNISLGHNRLSIIDLSKAGHQPMISREGTLCLVFNGEIYNYREIRRTLEKKGYQFISNTDSEVVLYAFEEYREKCLDLFNGMFAFVIWDRNKKQLFLARDRLGIKPLYYYFDGEKFIFSSELKAILLHEIKKELNLENLNSFLKYRFIPSNKTIFKYIKKLLPGTYAIYDLNKKTLKKEKYWNLKWEVKRYSISYFLLKLKELLFSSVELRLNSDVPLGIFLSGGIDSSLITAINSKLRNEEIKTFTVGFGHKTDEFKYSRIVAEYLSTNHHEVRINYNEVNKNLPKIIWQMDEPHSEMTIVPLYFLCKEAKKHVTVINTGEGADEIFSGYPYFFIGSYLLKPIPKSIKKIIYKWYYSPFKQNERKELLNFPYKEDNTLNFYLNSNKYPYYPKETLNKLLNFEIKHELPNWELNRLDKIGMYHSMEGRVPFLDHRIVELSAQIPIKYKQYAFDGKFILKKLAYQYLPKEIVNRKKQGFFVPMHDWINNSLKDLLEIFLFRNRKPFLNYYYIEKLLQKQKKSSKPKPFQMFTYQLLTLLFFNIWYEMYIENVSESELIKLLSL